MNRRAFLASPLALLPLPAVAAIDQRFKNTRLVPVRNLYTGRLTYYLEKRKLLMFSDDDAQTWYVGRRVDMTVKRSKA